jgi:hypothetical protein
MSDPGLFQELTTYIHAGKETLDLMKAALGLLPKSDKRAGREAVNGGRGSVEA